MSTKRFSLDPDPWNEWIYDPQNPEYSSDKAEYLRGARARALSNAPKWLLCEALVNDTEADQYETGT